MAWVAAASYLAGAMEDINKNRGLTELAAVTAGGDSARIASIGMAEFSVNL